MPPPDLRTLAVLVDKAHLRIEVIEDVGSGTRFLRKRLDRRRSSEHARKYIASEFEFCTMFKHTKPPAVMTVYDATLTDDYMIVDMEYYENGDLHSFIVEQSAPMPFETMHGIMQQLVRGVAWLHMNGIAHRDIKLENICMDDDRMPRLIDFGLAKRLLTARSNSHVGTLFFAAPEVVAGDISYDARASDVWSLGCVFYAIITGKLPFSGRTKADLIDEICSGELVWPVMEIDVPDWLITMVTQMTEKRPANRPTADELFEDCNLFPDLSPKKKKSPRQFAGNLVSHLRKTLTQERVEIK